MLLVNTSTFLLTALVINLIIYYPMSYTLQLLINALLFLISPWPESAPGHQLVLGNESARTNQKHC